MVKDGYVSFETAKLLKEKGYDGYCFKAYSTDGTIDDAIELCGEVDICNSECTEGNVAAPTLQDAARWLREQYELLISINPTLDKGGWLCVMYYIWDMDDIEKDAEKSCLYSIEHYNECADDSIRHCLEKLI